ncbi:unnamed protein product, partial [marine sediment metagenome]
KAQDRTATWSTAASKKVKSYMALEAVNKSRAITLLSASGKIKIKSGQWEIN